MKRALFVLSLLVLSSVPLLAQDNPFVGTWKLNLAKSKFEPGPAPKSQTRTVVAQGDGAKYTFVSSTTGRITRLRVRECPQEPTPSPLSSSEPTKRKRHRKRVGKR